MLYIVICYAGGDFYSLYLCDMNGLPLVDLIILLKLLESSSCHDHLEY